MPRAQAPSKDLALLRKLKSAPRDPTFRPTDLLGDASPLLEKANSIQGFLKGQRQRTKGSNSKTEWMLAAQQLQDEQEAAEKELSVSLRSILSSSDPDMVAFAADMLSEWQGVLDACRSLHVTLKQQVHSVVGRHGSIRQQHVTNVPDEARQLLQVTQDLWRDSQQECESLAGELEQIHQQVQGLWPTAIANPHATTNSPQRSILSLSPASTPPQPPNQGHSPHATVGSLTPIPEQRPQSFSGADTSESAYEAEGWGGAGGNAAAAWARDAQQLDSMIACFPLANDTTKARVRVVFAALRQRHQQKLDAWHDEGGGEGGAGAGAGLTGSWPEAEHSLFVSLRMKCWRDRAGGRVGGASRDALMRQLALLMPSRTLQELIAHDDWLTNHKIMQRKRRGLLDAWAREKAQYLEDSAALLDESHEMAAANAAAAADRLVHELGREVLHGHLEDLRGIAREEAQAAAAAKAVAAAAAAEQQAVADALAREEAAQNKALIAAYRAELQAKFEAEAIAAAEAQAASDAARSVQAACNRERVEWRHAELLVKQDKRRELVTEQQAETDARAARLARLRALVAPDVACDPARVLLPTEASMAVDDKAPGAFREVHGYTVDQVYKDQRMRVWEALQAAGVANTQYGRQMVREQPAATCTRTDNLTVDQRQRQTFGI